jgi:hypothetical protein
MLTALLIGTKGALYTREGGGGALCSDMLRAERLGFCSMQGPLSPGSRAALVTQMLSCR